MSITIGNYSVSVVFYRTLCPKLIAFSWDDEHFGFTTPFCNFTIINEVKMDEYFGLLIQAQEEWEAEQEWLRGELNN